jgi:CRISPR/Cas system CSM-associated protein Csm5 (group 7 of RAMP superfamily)
MTKPLLTISKLENVKESKIPGFCVASTAPINVEGDNLPTHKNQVQNFQQITTQQEEDNLNTIAELIYQKASALSNNKTDFVELVISTHGFSNSREASQQRFEEIYSFINKDNSQQFKNLENNLIYIGYR